MLARSLTLATALAVLVLALPLRGAAAVTPAILAAAKSERTVVWYSSLDTPSQNMIVEKFNQSHPGIVAQSLELSSNQIAPRVMTEETAGKVNADVLLGDQFAINQLAESGFL